MKENTLKIAKRKEKKSNRIIQEKIEGCSDIYYSAKNMTDSLVVRVEEYLGRYLKYWKLEE